MKTAQRTTITGITIKTAYNGPPYGLCALVQVLTLRGFLARIAGQETLMSCPGIRCFGQTPSYSSTSRPPFRTTTFIASFQFETSRDIKSLLDSPRLERNIRIVTILRVVDVDLENSCTLLAKIH